MNLIITESTSEFPAFFDDYFNFRFPKFQCKPMFCYFIPEIVALNQLINRPSHQPINFAIISATLSPSIAEDTIPPA